MDDCVLWGSRIVVPKVGHAKLLSELHEGHLGISRMKALARTVMWWPSINQDVENTVNQCRKCQMIRLAPPTAPLQP